MKLVKLFAIALITISCASKNNQKLNNTIGQYENKTHTELKQDIVTILDNHPEFDESTKNKIENVLVTSLEQNQNLKAKESKLAQHFIRLTLVDQAKHAEIVALRKEMTRNYQAKIKLFEETSSELKKIIGIKPENEAFVRETGIMFR